MSERVADRPRFGFPIRTAELRHLKRYRRHPGALPSAARGNLR
jgi:hypothetical protein